ncbi:MAG: cyclase family protein [Anaerolineae bacterium]|nr:cyclase family protein [Anaerolineae bacterium]
MIIHDLSLTLNKSLVIWPGNAQIVLAHTSHQAKGDRATVTYLGMSAHTGTHVDAPCHFLRDRGTVDQLDLTVLVGPAWVVDAADADAITAAVLDGLDIPPGTERLLIRTRNSALWTQPAAKFAPDYVGVTADGARWLVDHGVRLIGMDYLSVAPWDDLVTCHKILLSAEVIIVEGLNLSAITPGAYQFVCLPLKLDKADGAPARAILIEED